MWWRKRKQPSLTQQNIYSRFYGGYSLLREQFVLRMQFVERKLTIQQKKAICIIGCVSSAIFWCIIIYKSLK